MSRNICEIIFIFQAEKTHTSNFADTPFGPDLVYIHPFQTKLKYTNKYYFTLSINSPVINTLLLTFILNDPVNVPMLVLRSVRRQQVLESVPPSILLSSYML